MGDQLIFGDFLWKDQGWGGRKTGIRLRLNKTSDPSLPENEKDGYYFDWTLNKGGQNDGENYLTRAPRKSRSIYYQKPGSCGHRYEEMRFTFNFSDLGAEVGDRVSLYYWVGAAGGHSMEVQNFTLFTLPSMIRNEGQRLSWETGNVCDYTATGDYRFEKNWAKAPTQIKDNNHWMGDDYYSRPTTYDDFDDIDDGHLRDVEKRRPYDDSYDNSGSGMSEEWED